MRKYIIYIASAIITSALLSSCEKYLPVPSHEEKGEIQLVATSLVTVGDSIKVRLAHTESPADSISEPYPDKSLLLRALMFPHPGLKTDSMIMEKYYNELLIKDGNIGITTGSGEHLSMEFNPNTSYFECAHKVTPGERLQFSASVKSKAGKSLSLSSTTVVPSWKPEAEVVEIARRYKKCNTRDDFPITENTPDSVYEFKINIKDKSQDIHCYRIRIRAAYIAYEKSEIFKPMIHWNEAFYSNDPLLYDEAIINMFGAWNKHTTDVFTNKQFSGDSYVLTVQTRYPSPYMDVFTFEVFPRFIEIELQPITSDLMNYLSSLYRVRSATSDYFSEPQSLSSNINGGVGVFGAIGEPLKFRYWFPGKYQPDYPSEGVLSYELPNF